MGRYVATNIKSLVIISFIGPDHMKDFATDPGVVKHFEKLALKRNSHGIVISYNLIISY